MTLYIRYTVGVAGPGRIEFSLSEAVKGDEHTLQVSVNTWLVFACAAELDGYAHAMQTANYLRPVWARLPIATIVSTT